LAASPSLFRWSLVYLAGQIRQNTRVLKVSTTSAVATSDLEYYKLLLSDPELEITFSQGLVDRASLSDLERRRFDILFDMTMRTFQRDYFFAQDGAIKDSIWQGERKGYTMMLCSPGGRQWWSESVSPNYYGDEFRSYLEGLIREGEAAA
jgi:hypothetical protein